MERESRAVLVSGHDFTGCGKTQNGGRRGIYPPCKANQINTGFSRGGTLSATFAPNPALYQGTTSVVPQMDYLDSGFSRC
jgi:hypothetical protein